MMNKDKFDLYVNDLLEPVLKSQAAKNARYRSADVIRHESNLRLQPKGKLTPCGDCDQLVSNRVIYISAKDLHTDYPFWQRKCGECGEKTRIRSVK